MKLIIILMITTVFSSATSIYGYTMSDIDMGEIDFSDFQGKKILIVNIATESNYAGQLAQLEFLHQQFSDSLVVIGIPSNSFNHEKTKSNAQIKEFCRTQYNVSFLLAAKGDITGSNIYPLYQWLTNKNKNGQVNTVVEDDFQKYIVDGSGELIAFFTGEVSPLSEPVLNAITRTHN